jgi:hypothetical protein
LLVLAIALLCPGCGRSDEWSVEHAQSVRVVRGYPLRDVECRPLERAFFCNGVTGKNPVRAVWVTYIVHPRGSGYYLSDVRFYAFGVP